MEATEMLETRKVRRRRSGDDRGVALIEAALVLPVVLIVVFGIIEVGLLFRSASVTTASTRSGARLGSATYGLNPGYAAGTAGDQIRQSVEKDLSALQGWARPVELWIYRSSTNGDPVGGICGTDCIKFTWDGSRFNRIAGSWPSPDACGQVIDRLGVFVSVRHDSITGTALSRTVKQQTVMRVEPKPFGVCAGE
jgi:hypothetical protein